MNDEHLQAIGMSGDDVSGSLYHMDYAAISDSTSSVLPLLVYLYLVTPRA